MWKLDELEDPRKVFYERPPLPLPCLSCNHKDGSDSYAWLCKKYDGWCNLVYLKCHFETYGYPKAHYQTVNEIKRILIPLFPKPKITMDELTEKHKQSRVIPAITIEYPWAIKTYTLNKEDLKLKGFWNKILKKRTRRKIDKIWDEMCKDVKEMESNIS